MPLVAPTAVSGLSRDLLSRRLARVVRKVCKAFNIGTEVCAWASGRPPAADASEERRPTFFDRISDILLAQHEAPLEKRSPPKRPIIRELRTTG